MNKKINRKGGYRDRCVRETQGLNSKGAENMAGKPSQGTSSPPDASGLALNVVSVGSGCQWPW